MFFRNYNVPGKGVQKRSPDEPRINIFRDVFPRKLWNLFKLNLLYLLASLPFFLVTMIVAGIISIPLTEGLPAGMNAVEIGTYDILIRVFVTFLFMVFLGFGPITAGFIHIIREHASERPCWLLSDFFGKAKENFKQSIVVFLLDLLAVYVLTVGFRFYGQSGNRVFQYVILLIALIFIMMHTYIYPIMITFRLPLKHILKNSLLMTMGKAPVNLLILLLNIIIYTVVPVVVIMSNIGSLATMIILLAEVVFLPSITTFITVFYLIPLLEQYMSDEKN